MIKYQEVLESKYEEINALLELFNGSVSLNEILNMEIPILIGLRDARVKVNKQRVNKEIKNTTK